jgi:2'-5' RNA ligase
METLRYVIIAVPPKEIAAELQKLINILAELTGSQVASAYPPHITLRTGVLVSDEDFPGFIEDFGRVVQSAPKASVRLGTLRQSSMDIQGTKDFFIGYEIEEPAELITLHTSLLNYRKFQKSEQKEFWPHLSLAYGDLGAEGFEKAKKWIREHPDKIMNDAYWEIDRVGLYYQNDGQWLEKQSIEIGSAT